VLKKIKGGNEMKKVIPLLVHFFEKATDKFVGQTIIFVPEYNHGQEIDLNREDIICPEKKRHDLRIEVMQHLDSLDAAGLSTPGIDESMFQTSPAFSVSVFHCEGNNFIKSFLEHIKTSNWLVLANAVNNLYPSRVIGMYQDVEFKQITMPYLDTGFGPQTNLRATGIFSCRLENSLR
jgi:hypothetical protein